MATETGDECMEGSFPLHTGLHISACAADFELSLELSAARSSTLLFLELMNKVVWEKPQACLRWSVADMHFSSVPSSSEDPFSG